MTRKQETFSAKWTANSNEEFQETDHAKKRKRLQVQCALVQLQNIADIPAHADSCHYNFAIMSRSLPLNTSDL